MAEKCMCNCYECNLQEDHEARVGCAAFMAVKISADNKKQMDYLIALINRMANNTKKETSISQPILSDNTEIAEEIESLIDNSLVTL